MRIALLCTLALLTGCTDKDSDSAEADILCAGNSIYIEVCIECGDAGGCDEMGYECRAICDAQEDCPPGIMCTASDEGSYCDQPCD